MFLEIKLNLLLTQEKNKLHASQIKTKKKTEKYVYVISIKFYRNIIKMSCY